MNLEEVASIIPLEVKRESEFKTLGTISSTTPNLLVFLEDKKYLPTCLNNPSITCVITTKDISLKLPNNYGVGISDNPRKAFYKFHNYLSVNTNFYWHDFPSEISDRATVHPSAYVAPQNVRIGPETIIGPNVIILERSTIGSNVIIRSGSTIGTEGFEFKRIDDKILSVVHAGGVKICDHVEIQANCAISKALFNQFTEIGEYTKLDNLVHIAHDAKIGKRTFIAASTTISGSVQIGNDVWIGPGAVISNQINIGDSASITLGSVVVRDVQVNQKVSGYFAIEHKKFLHNFRRLMKTE